MLAATTLQVVNSEAPTFDDSFEHFSSNFFIDEANFWLNGYVNKRNCRIWDEEQPEVVQELPLHPEKTTIWCGLWAGGIIGPYFFQK